MRTSDVGTGPAGLPAQPSAPAGALRGALLLPGSAEYARRTAPVDRGVRVEPAAVAVARDAYDVVAAVRLAGAQGLRVAVQAVGRGADACGGDTLLVVTDDLDECGVHAADRWARVGAGVRWRTLLEAARPYGLTGLPGSSGEAGVVDDTTGGGAGPLARAYGLASDRVRALDVVTGRGRLVRATATSHPDLFWALRGGAGSLGVVTALELELVALRTVHAGALHFVAADAGRVLHAWPAWCARLPRSASTSAALVQASGRPTVAIRFAYAGRPDEGERLLAPLRSVATPVRDDVRERPATDLDAAYGEPPALAGPRCGGLLLRELPPQALEALLALVGPDAGSPVSLELRQLGGATGVPPAVPSAVCHRDAAFALSWVVPADPDQARRVLDRTRQLAAAVAPWATGGAPPGWGAGPAAYDAAALERLRALVALHDPGRVLVAADALL